MFKRVLLVAGSHLSTRAIYHALPSVEAVLLEQPESRGFFLRRRARRLGWPTVLGQVAFQATVVPLLKRLSKARIQQIFSDFQFRLDPIPNERIRRLKSLNSEEAARFIGEFNPDLVVVHGTRILSARTLSSCDCPWVNLHAGITPQYRGSHGGYWALRKGDREHCGVTLHLVDEGIDTGDYLAKALISPTSRDNFVTYPWLQLGEGIKLLKQALETWPVPTASSEVGDLYYHPTLWDYGSGLIRGVP